ncbi:MAG: ATP phosphoribosyltransferase [Gemmatimonadaceae bacterium]
MLRIALPNKGRLSDDARDLFNQAGLEVRVSGDRALSASLGGEFEAIFVRAQDVPEFVADGAADAGITGFDIASESERELTSLLDLEFGRCRLVVAAREDSSAQSVSDMPTGARVATVFPKTTRRFFETLQKPIQIVPMSGAAEIAPHLGIADFIVDITSTGSTLKTNGLREIGTVADSTAKLFGCASRQTWPPEKQKALEELIGALDSVVRARGKRYLMANVPRTALSKVKEILPGLNGPTVVDILDGGIHVAVHAVVPTKSVYRTIAALKTLGAEGILLTRIERLMP